MPSFKELSENLSEALDAVSEAKVEYDDLLKQAQAAQAKYLDAVSSAQGLKQQMSDLLNAAIPSTANQNKVR